MSRDLMSGSARPVYLVDPNTRQIQQGSALPVAIFDADGVAISLGGGDDSTYVLINGTRNIVAAAADFTISDTAEDVLSIHRDTNIAGSNISLLFQADDSANNLATYARIIGNIVINTAATETSKMSFEVKRTGAWREILLADWNQFVVNPDGIDINFVVESSGDTQLIWADGGNNVVTVGSNTELAKLGIDGNADEIQFAVQGHSTQTSDLVVFEDSAGTDTLRVDQQAIFDYRGTMANSSKAPQTVAPDDWVEIKIGGTTYFLPAYLA